MSDAVAHPRKVLGMSERRACTLVAADRKMIRYRSRRSPDIELRSRLRDLANERHRGGTHPVSSSRRPNALAPMLSIRRSSWDRNLCRPRLGMGTSLPEMGRPIFT